MLVTAVQFQVSVLYVVSFLTVHEKNIICKEPNEINVIQENACCKNETHAVMEQLLGVAFSLTDV